MEAPENFYDNFFDFRIGFDLLQIRPAAPITFRDSVIPPLKIPLRLTGEYAELRPDGKLHQGVDFGLSIGDTVYSSFCGEVRIETFDYDGYGNVVVVRNYNLTETLYGHLDSSLVRNGQKVTVGQPIGLGGNTGVSSGPHLHFEIRSAGYSFNPIVKGLFFGKYAIYR
jgi:murein DD-endopeptidase MepM/ murein hydrolase activator NlpD